MGFKECLKKDEKIRYLATAWKMRNDKLFRDKFASIYDKPNSLLFEHLGLENIDKNIYLIYVNNAKRGFFSLFNLVLDGLEFADYYNLTPVIEYGEDTIYHEPDGVDGIINSFEYYFKQPDNVTVNSARRSRNVVFFESLHRRIAIPDFNFTVGASLTDDEMMESYLSRSAKTIQKYIHFSDKVQVYLDRSVTTLMGGKRTLGVHIRGTDMNVGYNGHAKVVPPVEYLEKTREILKSGCFDQVFLATDETDVIELFKHEFTNRLIYFSDVLRSEDGQALHFSQNERKNHRYLLGLEVLKDMYALALSDGLIAGISNVSLASRMMKKSLGAEYEQLEILSHGFNKTKISMVR